MEVRLLQSKKAPSPMLVMVAAMAIEVRLVQSMIPNAGDAIWDSDRGQVCAPREGQIPNAGDAIWGIDRGQASAAREGAIPNAGYR